MPYFTTRYFSFLKWLCIAALSINLMACQQKTETETHASAEAPLVSIENHWVRATHPGQSVAAAYMTLTGQQNLTLTHASADVAEAVEVHDMKMEDGIMKMRHIESLPISKGKPTNLAPGGFHLMLFDLKEPLKAGTAVNFELCFADEKGEITIIPLTTKVKAQD